MSTQLIGLENIPNVYIEKVVLNDSTDEQLNIYVNLELYDQSLTNQSVWSQNEIFTPFLKVCLIHTSDANLTAQLSKGLINPVPKKLFASGPLEQNKTFYKTYSMKQFSVSNTPSGRVFKIKSMFQTIENKNLSIFAFCFLDTDQVSRELNIDLSNKLDGYFGALTSEKIFINGNIPKTSVFYVNPNGSIYTGPVHLHNGKYMQGSLHTPLLHSNLKTITVHNLKTIDNREAYYRTRKIIKNQPNSLISDSYFSVDYSGGLSGLFSFNVREFALSKTKYGRKFINLNKNLFKQFLNTIRIDSLSITRKQIKISRGVNSLQTPHIKMDKIGPLHLVIATEERTAGSLKRATDEKSTIQQIYIDSDDSIRSYVFTDLTKTKRSHGNFQYQVDISIIDTSQDFFNKLIKSTQKDYAVFKEEVDFLNSKVNYDKSVDKLKKSAVVPRLIEIGIKRYYELFSIIYDVTEKQQRNLIKEKLHSFSSGNYNASLSEQFLADYRGLISEFIGNFRTSSPQNITYGKVSPRKSNIPNYIKIKKEFSEMITFNDYNVSYDCLGLESPGMKTISIADYEIMANKNIDRYFDGSKSYTPDPTESLDPAISSAITNFSFSKYLYLTPLSFNVEDGRVNVSRLDKIDLLRLSGFFVESQKFLRSKPQKFTIPKKTRRGSPHIHRRKRQVKPPKPNRSMPFSFSRFKKPDKVKNIEDNIGFFIDSREYLGDNSEFPKASEDLKSSLVEQEDLKIFKSLSLKSLVVIPRDKKNYDVTKNGNIINKLMSSKRFNKEKLIKAPLPLKALLASRTTAARNNILQSDSDVLKDTETNIATEITFFSTQRIQVLIGYGLNSQGVKMLAKPIWKDMTPDLLNNNKRKVCRMVYEESEEFEMKPDDSFKFPVLDKIFILSDTDVSTRLAGLKSEEVQKQGLKLKNDLSRKIIFSTTNTVVQNKNKMAIFEQMPIAPATTISNSSLSLSDTPGITSMTSIGPSSGGY